MAWRLVSGASLGFRLALLLGRDFDVHDDAVSAGGHFQRRVFDVGGFFTENGAQQTFFGRQFGFALGRDFADENVAGLDFRADADDAVGPEVLQRFVAEVRDVAGDFLGAELGVAGADFEFVDVNGGEHVVLDDAFADEDGVLEVISVPRHERAKNIAAQGQFSALGAGTVGDDLPFLDRVALGDQNLLIDAGGGVGTHEFADGINPDAVGRHRS